MCHSHFHPNDLKRAPGSKRVNRVKGAYPQLFPWNNWFVEGSKRREIIRSFPRESSPIRDNSGSVCSMDLDISEIRNTDLNLQESSLQLELEELNKLHKENAELIQENKYLKLENKELKEKTSPV